MGGREGKGVAQGFWKGGRREEGAESGGVLGEVGGEGIEGEEAGMGWDRGVEEGHKRGVVLVGGQLGKAKEGTGLHR